MNVEFREVQDTGWAEALDELDTMCARWNDINVSLEDMSDDDADTAYAEMESLNRDIRKQRAKAYRLAKRAGVKLPGSRWAN